MNIQRLMFAYARGARMEYYSDTKGWVHTIFCPASERVLYRYRVHPDDEHLLYGPLSSALRTLAMDNYSRADLRIPLSLTEVAWSVADVLGLISEGNFDDLNSDEWLMYQLFTAELLADEGL